VTDALEFCKQQKLTTHCLLIKLLAEDLASASASEAFVERIFLVAGMLSVTSSKSNDKIIGNVCF
jgi:hypothetical protein